MATNERISVGIRKNDQVQVIAGKEKGKIGKVLVVDRKSARVTVDKLNLVKRHVRPSQKFPQGGIIEKELSVHYSNVLLVCSKCDRGVRHGHQFVPAKVKRAGKDAETMMKIRICKRCGSSLEAA